MFWGTGTGSGCRNGFRRDGGERQGYRGRGRRHRVSGNGFGYHLGGGPEIFLERIRRSGVGRHRGLGSHLGGLRNFGLPRGFRLASRVGDRLRRLRSRFELGEVGERGYGCFGCGDALRFGRGIRGDDWVRAAPLRGSEEVTPPGLSRVPVWGNSR